MNEPFLAFGMRGIDEATRAHEEPVAYASIAQVNTPRFDEYMRALTFPLRSASCRIAFGGCPHRNDLTLMRRDVLAGFLCQNDTSTRQGFLGIEGTHKQNAAHREHV